MTTPETKTALILHVPSLHPQDNIHIPPLPFKKLPISNPFLYYEKFPPITQVISSGVNSSLLAACVSGAISWVYWKSYEFPRNIIQSLTQSHMNRYAVIGMIFGSVQRSISIYRSNSDKVDEHLSDYAISGIMSGIVSGIYVGRPYICVAHGFWFGTISSAFFMIKEGYVHRNGILSRIMATRI